MPHINPNDEVYVETQIENHLSVEDFIKAVRAAAKGLRGASVEAEHAFDYGDCSARINVTGYRPATEAEKAEAERSRRAYEIRQEEMLAAQRRIEDRLNNRSTT